jgi:hypothetical protein
VSCCPGAVQTTPSLACTPAAYVSAPSAQHIRNQGRDLPSQFSSQFGSVQPLAGVAIIAPTSRMLRDGPV